MKSTFLMMAAVGVALQLAPAAAGEDIARTEAKRLLGAMHQAEAYVLAGVQTRDTTELYGRSLALHRAVSEQGSREVLLSTTLRPCFSGTTSLAVLSDQLSKMAGGGADAKLLVSTKSTYGAWRTEIDACEAALGSKRARTLKLDLG